MNFVVIVPNVNIASANPFKSISKSFHLCFGRMAQPRQPKPRKPILLNPFQIHSSVFRPNGPTASAYPFKSISKSFHLCSGRMAQPRQPKPRKPILLNPFQNPFIRVPRAEWRKRVIPIASANPKSPAVESI